MIIVVSDVAIILVINNNQEVPQMDQVAARTSDIGNGSSSETCFGLHSLTFKLTVE
jgi:hypothetical protein